MIFPCIRRSRSRARGQACRWLFLKRTPLDADQSNICSLSWYRTDTNCLSSRLLLSSPDCACAIHQWGWDEDHFDSVLEIWLLITLEVLEQWGAAPLRGNFSPRHCLTLLIPIVRAARLSPPPGGILYLPLILDVSHRLSMFFRPSQRLLPRLETLDGLKNFPLGENLIVKI